MAPLRCAAKFDPFLSLDCAPTPSTLAQSKERKGSNFAIWQPCQQMTPMQQQQFLQQQQLQQQQIQLHQHHQMLNRTGSGGSAASAGGNPYLAQQQVLPHSRAYIGTVGNRVGSSITDHAFKQVSSKFKQVSSKFQVRSSRNLC